MCWARCGCSRGSSAWPKRCGPRSTRWPKKPRTGCRSTSHPTGTSATDGASRSIEEYRLPRAQAERAAYSRQVGADGAWLLAQVAQSETPAALRSLAEVGLLQRFWEQEYQRTADGSYTWRDPKAVP